MTAAIDPTGSHHDPLDAVIAEYLQQIEAGLVPDRDALLARHPELADRLRDFFADYDRLDRQAAELRLSGDPNGGTRQTNALPRVRYFGDYELLEVIAHGGMGVVYKARQVSLNRVVALKMILPDKLATSLHVARFRTEAQAAANLDHPHIVPIYEVGEHEGRQYYAMRFIAGPSLLLQPRGDLRAEANLVATIARAVHFAHQRGILHRDVKPSNILLQAGVPFIADFGLARRLDEPSDLTASGEPVGTPRYMAPEQAAGRKDLTVAVDVYSLGVVLYERLTGSTPFRGDNVIDLLRQVREADAPPPSRLRPGLDRDLETICLKCLEKEPARRYDSAAALADDLERWFRGEPIQARPVGSLGRFWRWCRRNPAVAGLSSAVAASLLIGTALSTHFAVQAANQRANAERVERERAQAAEDSLEKEFALGLLAAFDPDSPFPGTLSPREVEALWRLACTSNDRLRLRFLAEALRTQDRTEQLSGRAQWFIHGAVGLDPERRLRVEQMLAQSLTDPEKSLLHRAEVAVAALEVVEPGSPIQRASTEVIRQAWAAANPGLRDRWRQFFLTRADRLIPGDAVEFLTQMLSQEKDDSARGQLASALAAVAERQDPAEAIGWLTQAWTKEKDARVWLSETLATVAVRLEAANARRMCPDLARLLSQAMIQENDRAARWLIVQTLVGVIGRLDPGEAARVCAEQARFLIRRKDWSAFSQLAQGMDPAAATQLLTQVLTQEKDPQASSQLAVTLAAVAGRLESRKAKRVCAEAARLLSQSLAQEKYASTRGELAVALAEVAGRLEPAEAARVCAEPARWLSQALIQEVNASARNQLAQGLAAVAGRLEPAEARRVCAEPARLLGLAVAHEKDFIGRWMLVEALAAVAERLEPADAARVSGECARILSQVLAKEKGEPTERGIAQDLAAVAARLEPAEAAQLLAQALTQKKGAWTSSTLARALAAAAGRLEPAQAAPILAKVARASFQAVNQEPGGLDEEILSLLLPSLDSETAVRAAQLLARWLVANPGTLNSRRDPMSVDRSFNEVLDGFLIDATPNPVRQRASALAAAVGISTQGPVAGLALLPVAGEPLPCRLTTQELVELLKMPTCVNEVRRVILDQLGNRYRQRFATHWDFVRFAQDQGLNLDFTTPPKRPEPKLPPLFEP